MSASWLQHLARASLEAGGIIAVIGLVTTLWPTLRASWRTLLWWCGGARLLLGLVTLPALKLSLAAPEISAAALPGPLRAVAARSVGAISTQALGAFATLQAAPAAHESSWAAWLLGLWALGMTAGLTWMITQLWRQRRVFAASTPADAHVAELLAQVAAVLEVDRVPNVRISAQVHSPLLAGFLRPRIMLPAAFVSRATDAELRLALCHELVHLQRNDLWLGVVPVLARVVFWFHPLAWWAAREYVQAREEATDAQVLAASRASASDYGQLLLAFMTTSSSAAFVAARAGSPHFESMKKRLEHLRQARPGGDKLWGYVAIASFVGLGLIPLQVRAEPSASEQAGQPPSDHTKHSVHLVMHDAGTPPPLPVPPVPPQAPLALPETPAFPAPPPPPARDDTFGFVLFEGDGDRATMMGNMDDLRLAKKLRKNGSDPVLFIREGGAMYSVRDAAVMSQVRNALHPLTVLGQKQAALGEQQAALGQKQAAIGMQEAALGSKEAALASERGSDSAREAAERAIEKEQGRLSEQQDELSRQQDALSRQQEGLSRQQEAATAESDRQLQAAAHEAIRLGKATKP